jgi:transcriptional regulator with XRE-family HTH domain
VTDSELCHLLGRRIRDLRRERGLTVLELSKRCGFKNCWAVRRIEKADGEHVPSLQTVIKLSRALGVDIYRVLCVLDTHEVRRSA